MPMNTLRLILVDTDSSGFIDADELLELGKAVNPKFTPEKCRALLDRMDSNHDGTVTTRAGDACSGTHWRTFVQRDRVTPDGPGVSRRVRGAGD